MSGRVTSTAPIPVVAGLAAVTAAGGALLGLVLSPWLVARAVVLIAVVLFGAGTVALAGDLWLRLALPLAALIVAPALKAQNLLLIDLERCTRCDLCVRACADTHDGVTRLVRDGLRYDKYLVATSCRSCRDPLCMVGCPMGSIRRRDSLEIVIEDWCIGCGLCAESCPYGNINMHPFTLETDDPESGQKKAVVREKATTCDLSADYREPACVYACPHNAAMRVNPNQFFGEKLGLRP